MKTVAQPTGHRPHDAGPGCLKHSAPPLGCSPSRRPPTSSDSESRRHIRSQAQVTFLHPGPRASGNMFFWFLPWGVGTEKWQVTTIIPLGGRPLLSEEKKEKENQKIEDNLNILSTMTYLIRQNPQLKGQKLSNCINKLCQPMCFLQKIDKK